VFRTWYSNVMSDQHENPHERLIQAIVAAELEGRAFVISWPRRSGKATALAEVRRRVAAARAVAPSPAQAVAERIETRRATLPARLPDETPTDAVCDGWGLVPVPALDEDGGYEPGACPGCVLCSRVRPVTARRSAQTMAAMLADVADEEPM
jgi:hypothetical protein